VPARHQKKRGSANDRQHLNQNIENHAPKKLGSIRPRLGSKGIMEVVQHLKLLKIFQDK